MNSPSSYNISIYNKYINLKKELKKSENIFII